MSSHPPLPTPLEQLVQAWHQRAEAIRSATPASTGPLGRADALDSCAAQLAEVVRTLAAEQDDAPRDRETLSLFPVRESA